MAIDFPQLKCKLAELEKNTPHHQPRILCSLSGCLCKHVGWDHGQYMQMPDIIDCPKVALASDVTVKTRASYLDYRDGIVKIIGNDTTSKKKVFGYGCDYHVYEDGERLCDHRESVHAKCRSRSCPLGEQPVPKVEILNAYRDDKGSMKIDRPSIFGEDCPHQNEDTDGSLCCYHKKSKHKNHYCTERWCPILKGKTL